MADLPKERVIPGQPLFSHFGINYFGPFLEKQGRSQVKRYGCIFTCLTIRAVHIEIVHSLETDSFINTLRRLIARRGKKCASAEEVEVTAYSWILLQQEVGWIFNPPSSVAPRWHLGTVYKNYLQDPEHSSQWTGPEWWRVADSHVRDGGGYKWSTHHEGFWRLQKLRGAFP